MISVKNKWALITGASRGIGYLSALAMAQQGCNLILHSRDIKHCDKVKSETEALGVEVICVAAELANHNEVVNMLNDIDATGKPVDIVLNNAGIQVAYRENCWATPAEDFTLSYNVNLIAITTICYHLIPKMIARGFGRVVNTTSGIKDDPQQAAYSASKAALDKFTIDLAAKLDNTGVTLSLTDPDWCRTDLGGPHANHSPESALPGVIVATFLSDNEKFKGCRYINAQEFSGLTLEQACEKAAAI
ncbi:MAG: SDR family NAD(P)-dependent oxidoreductase [Pseudomonadales bacterium]